MELTLKTPACRTIAAITLAAGLNLTAVVYARQGAQNPAPSTAAMPASEQNALVRKYCVVCHDDAQMMAGLSLETFDAAHPDPAVAGMMLSKMKGGAMGAAGVAPPDSATMSALISALSAEAAGATAPSGGWSFKSFNDAKGALVTASRVQEVPSPTHAGEVDAYVLTLTCRKDGNLTINYNTQPAEVQITAYTRLGANGPMTARAVSPTVPGSLPLTFALDGTAGGSGVPKQMVPLPARTLTIRNLFPDETVAFPFDGLTPMLRQIVSTCSN